MDRQIIRRGDIFYIGKFGKQIGSEQFSGRPAIVISNNELNQMLDTVEIVYCTTQPKEYNKYHVEVNSTKKRSTVLCEQVTTVSKQRLDKFMGSITEIELAEISRAIAGSLCAKDISNQTKADERMTEIVRLQAERDTYKEMYEKLLKDTTQPRQKPQNRVNYNTKRSYWAGQGKRY